MGLTAVGVGLLALAGAAFVLSYNGIHAFALQAGISARLARGYPLIFDVLLLVILAAVLALRGAGLPSKALAWACLLGLLSAAAGADALHAAGRKLPAQDAAVTAAIAPWVLVLIAFALLLAMLRQARLRRLAGNRVTGRDQSQTRWEPQRRPPAPDRPLVPGFGPDEPAIVAARPVEPPRAAEPPAIEPPAIEPPAAMAAAVSAPAPAAEEPTDAAEPAQAAESGSLATSDTTGSRPGDTAWPAVPRLFVPPQVTGESAADTAGLPGRDRAATGETPEADLAIDSDLAPDDPSSDETAVSPAGEAMSGRPGPRPGQDRAGGDDANDQARAEDAASLDDSRSDGSDAGEADDPEMPVFHRMWSSPVPPTGA
jgi:hypothetical protein